MLKPQKITREQHQLTEVRNMSFHRPNDVASIEVALAQRIEHSVVERAIVAFGQEAIGFMTRFFELRTILISIQFSGPQTKEDHLILRLPYLFFPFVPTDRTCFSITRCTNGSLRPSSQHTTISPSSIFGSRFETNRTSPRWYTGSIDSEVTTTIGEDVWVIAHRECQNAYGVESMRM